MKIIGLAAIAAIAALVLGFGARLSAPTAHADATGNVTIGCEFLASPIDGDTKNDPAAANADLIEACDGLDTTDIGNLADALGDKDGVLEKSDFADLDLDANQIEDTTTPSNAPFNATYIIEFVNDEGPVTFDAPTGLTVSNGEASGPLVAPVAFTGGAELCNADADDADCAAGGTVGDGVVVANVTDGSATAGDSLTVTTSQESVEDPTDITVTGAAHDVSLALVESTVQATGSTSDFDDCLTTKDVSDSSSLSAADSTIAIATVTDADGTKLTRVPVTLASDDTDIADIATGDRATSTVGNTGESVDAGTPGVAQFAVVCGGTKTGTATIKATINKGLANEDSSSTDLTVVGTPASVALTASPAQIACDGSQTASVTAKVTDSAGNNVADGTNVNFSVVALGTANPINVKTAAGSASSTITPLSGSTAGVTVIVTAGTGTDTAQSSIRVDCSLPIPPTTPAGGAPTATPTGGTGTVRPPDTGNGGYLGQDGSAGFPMWTLVALTLGSVALVAGGMVTRRAGK